MIVIQAGLVGFFGSGTIVAVLKQTHNKTIAKYMFSTPKLYYLCYEVAIHPYTQDSHTVLFITATTYEPISLTVRTGLFKMLHTVHLIVSQGFQSL